MLLPLRVLINSCTRLTSLKDMVFLCFFVVILRCGNFQTFRSPAAATARMDHGSPKSDAECDDPRHSITAWRDLIIRDCADTPRIK